MTPYRIAENYINGNLTEAKEGAKRITQSALRLSLIMEMGYNPEAATAIAAFLKGRGTFQDACDAEAKVIH